MTGAYVLIWLVCGTPTSGEACHQERLYFDSYQDCVDHERIIYAQDPDGVWPFRACMLRAKR